VVPLEVTGGLESVGLRAPRHPVAIALIRALGEPIAAPSANAHMHVSPTTAQHVVSSLGDAVDLVLDGGRCSHGIESTVLALDRVPPRVLRPGATSLAQLRAIEPAVEYAPLVVAGEGARASPGLASKHYAPRARVVIASASELTSAVAGASGASGTRVAAIVVSEAGRQAAAAADPCMILPETAEGYARELYAALHRVDEAQADVVVVEDVPTSDPAWWAVADRLLRARQSFTTR
jgi:L-threonylcarbamoyladenylate synthase